MIKPLLLAFFILINITPVKAQNYNGLAQTPPMGWNSWNKFSCNVSDKLLREMADAMVSSGMAALGYEYINIDDCWQELGRDANKHVRPVASTFPNGIKGLADYVHAKGLKLGVYSDHGTKTCAGREGSHGYETIDATDYAAWGVDYLKYDNCNEVAGANQQKDYENMRDALVKSGRPIVYSICAWSYHAWEPATGNLWRTTGDIFDTWKSIMEIYDVNVDLAKYAKPGAWNDPDMLEVGNGAMTDTEYRSHMALWSIMAAPLIAGNDLRNMSAATKAILMAPEILAVNQDSLGKQATKIRDDGNIEVLSKPMKGTNIRTVALFNRGGSAADIKVSWSEIGLPSGKATVRELWGKKDVGVFDGSYTVSVPSHGTAMLRISSGEVVALSGGYATQRQSFAAHLYAGVTGRDFRLLYSIGNSQKLVLTLFDLKGQVQPFTYSQVTPGEMHLSLPHLEKGVYSLRLLAGGKAETVKLALLP